MLEKNVVCGESGTNWVEQPKSSFQALDNCLYLLFPLMDSPATKEEGLIFFSICNTKELVKKS